MSYVLLKLLSGGTFTTAANNAGVSIDWRTQFQDISSGTPISTIAGEICVPGSGTTYGLYGSLAVMAKNPYDVTFTVPEASSTYPVQVYVNGPLLSEVTGPGTVTVSIICGINRIEVVRGCAPISVLPSGPAFDGGKTSKWISLYQVDPFESGSGSGSTSGVSSTGLSGTL